MAMAGVSPGSATARRGVAANGQASEGGATFYYPQETPLGDVRLNDPRRAKEGAAARRNKSLGRATGLRRERHWIAREPLRGKRALAAAVETGSVTREKVRWKMGAMVEFREGNAKARHWLEPITRVAARQLSPG